MIAKTSYPSAATCWTTFAIKGHENDIVACEVGQIRLKPNGKWEVRTFQDRRTGKRVETARYEVDDIVGRTLFTIHES